MSARAIVLVRRLIYDDVIDNTIRVMRDLDQELKRLVASREMPDLELRELLLQMHSESIREALHRNELDITNSIIRSKNRLIERAGERVPDSHREIDPKAYGNYRW